MDRNKKSNPLRPNCIFNLSIRWILIVKALGVLALADHFPLRYVRHPGRCRGTRPREPAESSSRPKMENIHHIHEVLHLLFAGEQEFTKEGLHSKLKTEYGENVHFTSCSDHVFPIDEVVPFLLSRNKIRLDDNRIIPLTPACDH